MIIQEAGVLSKSERYFFTPSSFAEKLLYYPTRIGHYYCDARYHFSYQSDIARQAGHHLNYMLFLVQQGQLDITIDGASFVAGTRQAVLFDCKRPHEYTACGDLEFYWLLFNGAQSAALYDTIVEKRGQVFAAPDAAELQYGMNQLLTACADDMRLPEHRCSELLYGLLCHLLAGDAAQEGDWDSVMDEATAYMARAYRENIAIREVAARFHMSSSYFTKRFRARTGYSPYEYLVLRRIDQAKLLLTTSTLTVKQIAYETGYNSEENFIHSFKKKVGLSPSAFRQYPI